MEMKLKYLESLTEKDSLWWYQKSISLIRFSVQLKAIFRKILTMFTKQHILTLANESMTRCNSSLCHISFCDTLVKYWMDGSSFITKETFFSKGIWIGLVRLAQKTLGSYTIIQEILKNASRHVSQEFYHNTPSFLKSSTYFC